MKRLGTVVRALALAAMVGAVAPASADDVITEWDSMLRDAIRQTGGGPCPISRAGAMMHVAMFEAINSARGGYTPYLSMLPVAEGASQRVAAAKAAHQVLCQVYPSMESEFTAKLNRTLAREPDPIARQRGLDLGIAAANSVLTARANDGSQNPINYVPTPGVGHWRPTPPEFNAPHAPHWGNVTPFAMTSGDQFRPPPPPALNSQEYADAYNQVRDYGRRFNSLRTPEQTQIAHFWGNDLDGTYKPPGHLNYITSVVARDQGLSVYEKSRLFALVNLAMGDAAVSAWDAKYNTELDFWRPVTGIHEGDNDGNQLTQGDPTWEPLNVWSPPFPAYTSGHATFGAAHAAVMRAFFGTDDITFTVGTDDPFTPGVERTFHSFTEAAWENAISRIYLGVHWIFDGVEGNRSGLALGDYVAANFLQPIPAPGTAALITAAAGLLLIRRRR